MYYKITIRTMIRYEFELQSCKNLTRQPSREESQEYHIQACRNE